MKRNVINKHLIKNNIYRHYIANKWLIIHKQKSADLWIFNLFANELNMEYLK